jgi:hypothetical protein
MVTAREGKEKQFVCPVIMLFLPPPVHTYGNSNPQSRASQSKTSPRHRRPSGSGKTMGSLKVAKGLGGKILMIDAERGSGDLYADLFEYDIITLQPPYAPKNYVEAIHAAEETGYDVIIIDSLSHVWSDERGLLDRAAKLSAQSNRFTVWAKLTPQHRALVNALLNSPAHIVATVRSKQEYTIEKDEPQARAKSRRWGLHPRVSAFEN